MGTVDFKVLRDTNGDKLKALAKRLDKSRKVVRVGLPDSDHEGSHLTVAQIGAIHEYGAPSAGIPERPFLGVSLKKANNDIIRLNKVNLKMILHGLTTFDKALGQLGEFGQKTVQDYIATGDFVQLSPVTIARKGSSKPLIDTGQMRQSVSFVVVDK